MFFESETDRENYLNTKFKTPIFDVSVALLASHLIDGYEGCQWEVIEGDVTFMKPSGEQAIKVKNAFTGDIVEADSTLAGMIVTCYAVLSYIENGIEELLPIEEKLQKAIAAYCAKHNRMDVWWKIMLMP